MGGFFEVVVAGARGGRRALTGVVCPLGRGLASLRCLLMRVLLGAVTFGLAVGWGRGPGGGRGGIDDVVAKPSGSEPVAAEASFGRSCCLT